MTDWCYQAAISTAQFLHTSSQRQVKVAIQHVKIFGAV